jgi:hypothetical protein
MLIVPLQATPSQKVSVQLGGQDVGLKVYQKATGLYMDVYLSDTLLLGGIICQNLNRIVRSLYFGFLGDLMFLDNQGMDDPDYTGLGGRFSLMYIEASELPSGEG